MVTGKVEKLKSSARPFMEQRHYMERVLKVARDGSPKDAKLTIGFPCLENGIWKCFWSLDYFQSGISMSGEDELDSIVRVIRFLIRFIKKAIMEGFVFRK